MAPQYYESNGYGETVIEVERTPTCVFLRKNIRRVTETDEQGTQYTHWRYDEAKVSHEEYDQWQTIFGAASEAVEESETIVSMGEELTMVQEALVEVYEMLV